MHPTSALVHSIILVASCLAVREPTGDQADTKKKECVEGEEFHAITLDSDDKLFRIWLLPNDPASQEERLRSGRIPGVYIHELGLLRTSGKLRHRDIRLSELAEAKKLDAIDISQLRLTDTDVLPLLRQIEVRVLVLTLNDLTDAIIPVVENMPGLEKINLHQTKISETGLARLKKQLPELEINVKSWEEVAPVVPGSYYHLDFQPSERLERVKYRRFLDGGRDPRLRPALTHISNWRQHVILPQKCIHRDYYGTGCGLGAGECDGTAKRADQ